MGARVATNVKLEVQSTIGSASNAATILTLANPGVVTINSHGFTNGDYLICTSIDGMVELDGQMWLDDVLIPWERVFLYGDVKMGNALFAQAAQVWGSWGATPEDALRALMPLARGTLAAIENAMGTSEMLKFMSRIGRGLTEHTFEGGRSTQSFGMTPEAARSKISELRTNPEWSTKYMSGDAAAQKELQRLMQIAYPE